MKRIIVLFLSIIVIAVVPVWSQSVSLLDQHEGQPALIGLKLDELIKRFGAPYSVYSARGDETWQDDVVFTYPEGDFYIHRDRVWQIGLKSAFGLKIGDPKSAALLALGVEAQDRGTYILCPLPSSAWPLSIRVNCTMGRIAAIYVYRPDY